LSLENMRPQAAQFEPEASDAQQTASFSHCIYKLYLFAIGFHTIRSSA
jgi:hypothetical protein